jgi:anaerobic selenocysteine-containing dehydrogenase
MARHRTVPALLAIARLATRSGTWERDFVRRWVNWETYLTETRPDLDCSFDSLETALSMSTPSTPPSAPNTSAVSTPTRLSRSHESSAPTQRSSLRTTGVAAGAGNLGGWQVARCLFFLNVLTGSVGTPGGTAERLEQVQAAAPKGTQHHHGMERDELAEGVSPRLSRDVDPAAPLPQRGSRRARYLLHSGLQPDLDQPRRLLMAGGAQGPRQGRVSCGAHTDVVRDLVVCRLRLTDGCGPSVTTSPPTKPMQDAGSASGSRPCAATPN